MIRTPLGPAIRVRRMDEPMPPSSGALNPCLEISLGFAEPCLLPSLPEVRTWKDWIDKWPELAEIQRAWHETFPFKKAKP